MKFGFVIHPFNLGQLRAFAMNTDFLEYIWQPHQLLKTFLRKNRSLLDAPDSATGPGSPPNGVLPVYAFEDVTSKKGSTTSGIVVSIPLLPEQILTDQPLALELITRACEQCAAWGAEVVGLGAYTAIIGARGEKINAATSIPVTTGNSYTVFTTLLALDKLLQRIGRDLSASRVVIIGFQGSIGLALSKLLAQRGIDLVLVGRGSAKYLPRTLAKAIDDAGVNVELSTSVEEGVKRGDLVISASSSGQIIDQRWLVPGTVVFDVAQPRDVIGQRIERPDILVIDGGLARVPQGTEAPGMLDFWTYNTVFGCLAETMILALEQRAEPFSLGRELDLERIREIGRLGSEHGFGVDEFLSFGVPVERGVLNRLRKAEFRKAPLKTHALVGVEQGLQAGHAEVYGRYGQYMDPFLATALAALQLDKHYVRAEGIFLWDDEGRRYLDFISSYGALNLGHNHPKVVEAVQAALQGKVPNFLKPSTGMLTTALAETLALVTPGDLDTSFFCNSGAEANEGALKLARLFTGRTRLVYTRGSFHGKTLGALSVTHNERFRRPFGPLLPDCIEVPYGQLPSLAEVLQGGDVAAFIVEPIQGEGGINVPPDGYLKEAERLCKRHGTLLILDEVQTGFGRTGRMFAAEHWDVEPDILTLAKSLSGGLIPIGAFVTTSEIWDRTYGRFDHYNVHTSTFGGNNLAAAAGLAAIQVLYEEGLIDRAHTLGEYFSQQLKGLTQYKVVRQVRGKGLMLGVEFHDFLADIFEIAAVKKTLARFPEEFGRGLRKLSAEMLAQAVIIGELLNEYNIATQVTLHQSLTLRIQPPLIVTKDQIDYFIESLDRVCHRMDIMAEMCANLDSAAWSR